MALDWKTLGYNAIKSIPVFGQPAATLGKQLYGNAGWGSTSPSGGVRDFSFSEAAGFNPVNTNTGFSNSFNYKGPLPSTQYQGYGPSGSNGTGGGGTLSGQQVNSGGGGNPGDEMRRTAEEAARQELELALGEFDYMKEGLNAQSAQLDTQRGQSLSSLESERGRAEREAGQAKTEATDMARAEKSRALSTANDVVGKNRNVLRALGILSSSAGGEMLTRPMEEFQSQAGQIQKGLLDRLGKVEEWWMDQSDKFSQAKQGLESQYMQLKENIARDLRFNDRQRSQAVRAASTALSQRIAEISQQQQAYQMAAQQYSDNVLMQVAQLKMYQNPQADVSSIINTLLSQANKGYQGPQAQIMEDPRKRQQNSLLSGLG